MAAPGAQDQRFLIFCNRLTFGGPSLRDFYLAENIPEYKVVVHGIIEDRGGYDLDIAERFVSYAFSDLLRDDGLQMHGLEFPQFHVVQRRQIRPDDAGIPAPGPDADSRMTFVDPPKRDVLEQHALIARQGAVS